MIADRDPEPLGEDVGGEPEVEDVVAEVLARGRQRKRVPTFREVARSMRYVGGRLKGQHLDPSTDTFQDYLVSQMDLDRWERIYITGSPQITGKTLYGVILPMIRYGIHLRQPVGYGLPTLEDLDKAWVEKLKPTIEGCGYGDHLPIKGPGSKGGRGAVVQFRDPATGRTEGRIVWMAGGAYSSTVAKLVVDELDQFMAKNEPDWNAEEDLCARCDAYGSRARRYLVGTVEQKPEQKQSMILTRIGQGTDTRMHARCPKCGACAIIDPARMTYDPRDEESARDTARILCPAAATTAKGQTPCDAAWDEDMRLAAIRAGAWAHRGQRVVDGRVVGPEPRTRWLGVTCTAWDSSLSNLGTLAADELKAKQQVAMGDHGLMRKYENYRKCRWYTGDKGGEGSERKVEVGYLMSRAALEERGGKFGPVWADKDREGGDDGWLFSRHWAPIPRDAQFLTRTIDIQGNRCYWLMEAWDLEARSWSVAWGYDFGRRDHGEMNEPDLHALLDRVAAAMAAFAAYGGGGNGQPKPIHWSGVDANFNTDWIIHWLERNPDWMPLYGASFEKARRMAAAGKTVPGGTFDGILYRKRDEKWILPQDRFHIDTQPMRLRAQRSFLASPGNPGAAHAPWGLANDESDKMFFRHLCAETWDPIKSVWVKTKGGGRWDLLDCRVYSIALALMELEMIRMGANAAAEAAGGTRERAGTGWVERDTGWSSGLTDGGTPWLS